MKLKAIELKYLKNPQNLRYISTHQYSVVDITTMVFSAIQKRTKLVTKISHHWGILRPRARLTGSPMQPNFIFPDKQPMFPVSTSLPVPMAPWKGGSSPWFTMVHPGSADRSQPLLWPSGHFWNYPLYWTNELDLWILQISHNANNLYPSLFIVIHPFLWAECWGHHLLLPHIFIASHPTPCVSNPHCR